MTAPTAPPPAPSDLTGGRPPVEFRRLGLDRRTFKLPLIVVGFFVLWVVLAPALDKSLTFDDPVLAGDELIIGSTTTMAPPVGWQVENGVRTRDGARADSSASARTAVSGDGITVSTQTGPFNGDAKALAAQIGRTNEKLGKDSAFVVAGTPSTFTVDGQTGVAQRFKTLAGEGGVFAFVKDGTGYAVIFAGATDALDRSATKLGEMIKSIDFDAETSR
jgi:hypothetical protein